MEGKTYHCSSCKTQVANLKGSVRFTCPSCGKSEIIRCPQCRKVGIRYTCSDCSFSGPN